MNRPESDLFEPVEPPPGGLALLRRRLDRERERSSRRAAWAIAAGACAAAAVVVLLVMRPSGSGPDRGPDTSAPLVDASGASHPALIRYGLARAPSEPVSVAPARRGHIAVARVPIERPDVVFYWISSSPGAQPDSPP